jgi:DNA-binding MarR family transcriptional regulator
MVTRQDAAHELVSLIPAVLVNLRMGALFDLEAADLTANQLMALLIVSSGRGGRVKAGEVAGHLGISLPAATALVDRLAAAGVVARSQGADRRVVWVSLSELGQERLSRVLTGLEDRIERALEHAYDDEGLDALLEGVRRVASFADVMGEPVGTAGSRSADTPGAPGAPGAPGQAGTP